MSDKLFAIPEFITAQELKSMRKKFSFTQKEFALLINTSKSTVERWEISKEPITGPVVTLVKLLEKYPDYVDEVKVPTKVYPLRLWYMHAQNICTVIDVDENNKRLKIKNYTDNIMFRAFGNDEAPDYKMYEEFLESRCFPAGRDKMKLVLDDLGLPFYDPFMIIEKTQGKMAEDNFWIKIER